MYKRLIRTIFNRSRFLRKLVFKLERLLREDLYSHMLHEEFNHFLELLTLDATVNIQFARKGSINDGGYVFCDLGKRYSKLISFGVGDNVDFEYAISELVNTMDLYDPNVKSLPRFIENATLHKVGLGPQTGNGFLTLYDSIKDLLPNDQLLLKIDIEGGEWDSLVATDGELLKSFSQIFLELHHLHQVHESRTLSKYIIALEKLRQHHDLVNIHANNWSPYFVVRGVPLPDTIEITLLRKRGHSKIKKSIHPIAKHFNSPNNPEKPDYRLIF